MKSLKIILAILLFGSFSLKPQAIALAATVTDSFTDTTKLTTGSSSNYQVTGGQLTVQNVVDVGDGADGACTVSAATNINTGTCVGKATADGVNFSSTANTSAASTTIVLSSTPTGLAVGDEVLIINLQGTAANNANVGQYEIKTITAINTDTLTLNSALTNGYDGTTQKIMVQRVPNYTNVTINSGITLTANAFDGTKGGVVAFKANGTVTVDGTISASNLGYRGTSTNQSAGESFCGYNAGNGGSGGNVGSNGTCGAGGGGSAYGNSGTANGGGGGTGGAGGGGGGGGGSGRSVGGAGGGGAYAVVATGGTGQNIGVSGLGSTAGAGGAGVGSACDVYTCGTGGGGGGGAIYGVANLSKLFFGSAGGTGAPGIGDCGDGGNGGGIISIQANSLAVSGAIRTNGANGQCGGQDAGNPGNYNSGGGGGGAGGSIRLVSSSSVLGSNLVTSAGGSGGPGCGGYGYTGGAGGVGRIAVSGTVTGTTSPTHTSLAASGYQTSAAIVSTNLLSFLSVGPINSFVYNLSSLPAGSSATVQLSRDGSTWKNAAGTLNGTNSLILGSNSISLSNTLWFGSAFYYKIAITTNGTTVPTFDDITVDYSADTSNAPALSGNHTIYSNTSLTSYTDGDNASRIVSGADSGTSTGTTNSAVLTLVNGILTVNGNETVVTGSFSLTGGSMAIASGGVLKIGATLWAPDADADGYPDVINKVYYRSGTTLASALRRNAMTTLGTVDCNSANASQTATCCGDADTPSTVGSQLYGTTCKKCVSGVLTSQTNVQDLYNQCTPGTCQTGGDCNGSGSCTTGNTAYGTQGLNCIAAHYVCNGAGSCIVPRYNGCVAISSSGPLVSTQCANRGGTCVCATVQWSCSDQCQAYDCTQTYSRNYAYCNNMWVY
ncbi:hypothetical protein KKB64_04235 [Patescibacteria group bacterium]|nr:hypothetical protein [Patescibacteria group bacterium]MBU1472964.1 hypothetical protein [Patescibacteria group bacterium]